jgi:hypothetical protein
VPWFNFCSSVDVGEMKEEIPSKLLAPHMRCVCMYLYINVCMCVYFTACAWVYMHISYVYMHVYIYTYICMYVCIYIYEVCTCIHTCKQTNKQVPKLRRLYALNAYIHAHTHT